MIVFRKNLAVIMALLISCAAFAPLTTQPAEAATKYDLPSKVTNYQYKKGSWKKVSYSKLKYTKKGYLQTVKHSDGEQLKLKYSFYKNGKLKKITCPGGETFRFNKKGLVTKYCPSKNKVLIKYKYKGSDLYRCWDSDEGCWSYFSYDKYPNGNIKTIRMKRGSSPDACSDEDIDFITEFNDKGLLVNETEVTSSTNYITVYSYTYDKKGRVKSVVESFNKNKKTVKENKYVFSYAKSQKTKSRAKYTSVINTHIGTLNDGHTVAFGGGYMDAIKFILPTS